MTIARELVREFDRRGRPTRQAAKASGDITAHVADTNNPHATTAAQVGAQTPEGHAATDHTGITGCGGMDAATHASTDHTGITGCGGLDEAAHDLLDHTGLTGCGGAGGITAVRVSGENDLTGTVTLAAGSGVTLSQDDATSTITITGAAGGGSDAIIVTLKAHQAITAGQNVVLEADGEVNIVTAAGRRLGIALDSVSAGADVRVAVFGKAQIDLVDSAWSGYDRVSYSASVAGKCVINNSAPADAIIGNMLTTAPNHALNKTYSKSVAPAGSYPDTNNNELTNGAVPTSDYSDSRWTGWQNLTTPVDVIIDLGAAQTYAEVRAYVYSNAPAGIYAPGTISVAEGDASTGPWTSLGSVNPSDATGWANVSGLSGSKRYVKVTIARRGTTEWVFVGEIAVCGTAVPYCLVNPR